MKFSTLFNDYLNYSFRPGASLRCSILECPGRWMDEAALKALVDDARAVAQTSSSASLEYGLLKGDREHLKNIVVTMIHDSKADKPIAFNCLAYMEIKIGGRVERVTHLGLVMIDPDYRAHGLSWILYGLTSILLFFRNQLRPIWVSNVTQVPAVFGQVCESYENAYPSVHGTKRTFNHILIANGMMRSYRAYFGVGEDAEFDEERFVIKNSYTGGSEGLKKSFDEATKHRNEIYNDYCEREIDYARGDDILQIGQLTLNASSQYLLKKVPRNSMKSVIYQLLLLSLSSVALPVYYWFRSNDQLRDIRPWRGL